MKFKNDCRNSKSIGIEMWSRKNNDGKYYIKEETVLNVVKLVKELMKKYGIVIENIIRHYDVCGKLCPEPFVRNEKLWTQFLKMVNATGDYEVIREIEIKINVKIKEVQAINSNGFNFVRLRDLQDDKIKIGYDSKEALPYLEIVI